MRQVAFALVDPHTTHLEFRAPSEEAVRRVSLRPDQRRQLLLAFKEAMHNVLRHADARRVRIDLQLDQGWLRLSIVDDGRGFEVTAPGGGQGLLSMERRLREELGGTATIHSEPGAGTRVELRVPIAR
jgi:signal transduction histidine kinase